MTDQMVTCAKCASVMSAAAFHTTHHCEERAARIEWTVTRQEYARIAAAMVTALADPTDTSDYFTFTVTAETGMPGQGLAAWFGNVYADTAGAAVTDLKVSDMADLDRETERYEEARAARIESSYNGGR